MKKIRYIKLFLIIYLSSLSSRAISSPDFDKLGEAMKLNCKSFGDESCFSRFIAVSACAFYGIAKSDKSVKESLDISDNLFLLLTKATTWILMGCLMRKT